MREVSRISAFVGWPLRHAAVAPLIWFSFAMGASAHAFAQAPAEEAIHGTEGPAAVVGPVVPQQVRYAGKLANRGGDVVEAVFRIYAAAEGGEPLWTETQRVTVAEDGSYSVLLGGVSPSGLPQAVFAGGAARWLGVSVERAPEQERALLSSVPYAMKSADSESLAGHAASDFVTQAQLAALAVPAPVTPPAVEPNTSGTVTGSGTAGTVPLWTGALTQGNSEITQVGSDIGINQPVPAATLDVGGTENVNGVLSLPQLATATKTTGQRSQLIQLSASAWSSTTNAPVTSTFKLLTNFLNNNAPNASGQLELHFQQGTGSSTVLSIAGNGVIAFAPAQTFPGTIKSVTATSPVTAATTSGAVTLGLNTAALETTLNTLYPQLKTGNVFASFLQASQTAGPGSAAVDGAGTKGSVGVFGNSDTGLGVEGESTTGTGVEGLVTNASEQDAGVLGIANTTSGTGALYNIYAGVQGDSGISSTSISPVWAIGVLGTADDSHAGVFLNNSADWSTLYVSNISTGGTGESAGLFKTLMASSSDGTCGIGSGGSLSCTGQIKSLVNAGNGQRKVETYAVQSPENWMEDFGSGQLQTGVAVVTIDPAFAETVTGDANYHVFLTPRGDSKGLYVINATPTTFEVRESGGGESSLTFDYRIVAKRRGFEAQRLVDVTERFKSEQKKASMFRSSEARHKPIPVTHAQAPLVP